MIKRYAKGTTIEIWNDNYINAVSTGISGQYYIQPEDRKAEIVQVEHAYDNNFIVEIRREIL